MTAETAAALPAVTVVAAALVAVGQVAVAQLTCTDAARAAARLAARGEPAAVISSRAMAGAPPGATVAVMARGEQIVVSVAATVALPLGLALPVSGSAVADAEPVPEAAP